MVLSGIYMLFELFATYLKPRVAVHEGSYPLEVLTDCRQLTSNASASFILSIRTELQEQLMMPES